MLLRWSGVGGGRSKDRPFREHATAVLGMDGRVHGGVGAGKTMVGRLFVLSCAPRSFERSTSSSPQKIRRPWKGSL